MKEIRIKNLQELSEFAGRFASTLKGGEIIGLVGDLGAGKTAFTQKLAAALGVAKEVRSPTFILMQCFETGKAAAKRGVLQLCHVDAYRLNEERELFAIGFEEYAGKSGTVTVVEWSDRLPSLHAWKGFKEITIGFGRGQTRHFRIE